MKNIKAIIVDDEPAAVDVIKALIWQFGDDIDIHGIARNGLEAVQLITTMKPDLIFLDVDMPIMNGLQVMEKCPSTDFEVIFTTGSSEYALSALKLQAVDYLLKPIDPADFILALDRTRGQLQQRQNHRTNQEFARLQLPSQNGIIFLEETEIMYVDGKGSYSQIVTLNDERILVSKNIGQIEEKLSDSFFRCHNSHLVNLKYIAKFIHKDGYAVALKNGTIVEVSRRNKDQLLQALARVSK